MNATTSFIEGMRKFSSQIGAVDGHCECDNHQRVQVIGAFRVAPKFKFSRIETGHGDEMVFLAQFDADRADVPVGQEPFRLAKQGAGADSLVEECERIAKAGFVLVHGALLLDQYQCRDKRLEYCEHLIQVFRWEPITAAEAKAHHLCANLDRG